MKCRFCNKEADTHTSYSFGFKEMIVCENCVNKIIRGFKEDEKIYAMIVFNRISDIIMK